MTSHLALFASTTIVGCVGYLLGTRRSRTLAHRDGPGGCLGSLWTVGHETYVDGHFVEILTAKLPRDQVKAWTRFVLPHIAIFVRKVSDWQVLPGQVGALYEVRNTPRPGLGRHEMNPHQRNDEDVVLFLRELDRLGLFGGRLYRSWDAVREERSKS